MTKQIKRKTLILFMVLSVFMTTICSQTSVKAANKVYKNVKLIFEDNQGNTIKTFTKDITQGETLGQILGDQYPTMKADYKLGNFTGWYSSDCLYGLYSGKRYEKNTPVNIEYDYEEDDYDDDYDYSDDELAENERLADTEQADVQAEAFDTEADENGAAGTENDAADSGDEQ